jgi:hypothetical protein
VAAYVLYRTPQPDIATVQQVQTILQQTFTDVNLVVPNLATQCQLVESVAINTYLPGSPLPGLNVPIF